MRETGVQNVCPAFGAGECWNPENIPQYSQTSQSSQITKIAQDGCLQRLREGEDVSKMRLTGVQNEGARFAGVESEKRGQVESMRLRNTSKTSRYSQTHYADRVSPANAGRLGGVQNPDTPFFSGL